MFQKSDIFLALFIIIILVITPAIVRDNTQNTFIVGEALASSKTTQVKNQKQQRYFSVDNFSITRKGLSLIKEFEGFFPNVYNDPAGHATIGYGHLLHYGNYTSDDINYWGEITELEATKLLEEEIVKYELIVKRLVRVPLTQGQFDALVSFVYNVGEAGLNGSTLQSNLNSKNYKLAADSLLDWKYAGGIILPGLERRRNLERKLFLSKN